MKLGSMVGLCSRKPISYGQVVHAIFDLNGPVIGSNGKTWWSPGMGEASKGEKLDGKNKGDGVVAICDKMEIPLSAVSYVGDGWNDWPAFEQTLANGGRGIFVGSDIVLSKQLAQIGGEIITAGCRGLARWLLDEV
jgi:phosphoserine phosphatase